MHAWNVLIPVTEEQEEHRKTILFTLIIAVAITGVFLLMNIKSVLQFLKTKLGMSLILVVVGFICYAFYEPFLIEFSFNEIRVDKKFKEFTAVQLSDVHLQWPYPYVTESKFKRIIHEVNSLKPDYVFITGDLISRFRTLSISQRNTEAIYRCLRELTIPAYAVLGNNDYCAKDLIISALQRADVTLLRNESILLSDDVSLSGINSYKKLHLAEQAISDVRIQEAPLKLLLAHEPDVALAAKDHFDLQISGHTHGGQVIVPFGLGPLILPTMGRKVPVGLHKVGKMLVYVTKGIGISPLPKPLVRFNARAEVSVLRIVPKV